MYIKASSLNIWGTQLTIKDYHSNKEKIYLEKLSLLIKDNEKKLDPDCFYQENSRCKTNDSNSEIDNIASLMKKETMGHFDVSYSGVRDFGGIAQGFILEKFKKRHLNKDDDLLVDFGKDFLLTGKSKKKITLSEPTMPLLPFGSIVIQDGSILSSWSKAYGGKYHSKQDSDFVFVVLKGELDFSITRLDAWSSALILGGKALLKHLTSKKEYLNKWKYVYLDRKSNQLVCSKSVLCKKGHNSIYEIDFTKQGSK